MGRTTVASVKEVLVPDIGDFSNVDVIEVLVSVGDRINAEDPLVTLESDKAMMDVPAPYAGIVKELKINVGDKVGQGSPIVVMELEDMEAADDSSIPAVPDETRDVAPAVTPSETTQAGPEPEPASQASAPVGTAKRPPPSSLPPPVEKSGGTRPHASPSVRAFARELGADLTQIRGSGPKGRILKEDVQGFIKGRLAQSMSAPPAGGLAVPAMPEVDFSKFGEIELQPLSRIKKIAGPHLHRSWLVVPHVTQHDEADITELEAFRKKLKEEASKQGVRLTPLAFIMKASVAALKKHPEFNASLDPIGENLILKKYYHIGVAVDTADGLVVPVVRNVDEKGVFDLAAELADIGARARDKKLTPTDIQGGCFTISSLGGIGGTAFTPIVNAPEVAILGVSRSAMQPVYKDGQFVPRLILPLSLSYDHRVIDGAQAARFTSYLSLVLTDVRRLLL